MDNFLLQWESPFLGFYWNYNFVHMVYKKNIVFNIYGYQEKDIVVDCKGNNYAFYVHKDEIPKCAQIGYEYFVKKRSINQWLSLVRKNTQEIEKIKVSKKYPIKSLSYIEELFHEAVGLHYITQPLYLKKIEEKFNNLCTKYCISDEKKNLLLVHFEMTEVMKEQYDWYKLVLLKKITFKMLKKHLKKWKYITAGDSKQPMDFEYLRKRYKSDSIRLEIIDKQLKEIEQIKDGSLYRKNLEISETIPWDLNEIANILRTLSFTRFQTKQNWMKLWYVLENSLIGKSRKEFNVFDYTSSEIKDKKVVKGIDDRSSYLYRRKNNNSYFYYNGLDNDVRNSILSFIDYNKVKEVNGTTGYPGKVTGYVVCIDWNEDINTKRDLVNHNTILVVPQTTPIYVSFLSNCLGVITDEGGIAGHASIISRELKIPSLIGTHVATKVFKDGDYIELNTVAHYAKKIG